MNQNYTYIFVTMAKKYMSTFLGVLQNFSGLLMCAGRQKRLKIAALLYILQKRTQ